MTLGPIARRSARRSQALAAIELETATTGPARYVARATRKFNSCSSLERSLGLQHPPVHHLVPAARPDRVLRAAIQTPGVLADPAELRVLQLVEARVLRVAGRGHRGELRDRGADRREFRPVAWFVYAHSTGRFESPLRDAPGRIGIDMKADTDRVVAHFDPARDQRTAW